MSVKLMIDSASDISKKEAEALGIIMLPMTITFDGTDYFDGVDLLPRQFYEMLIESDALPKTGQISPFRFKEAFEKHTQNDEELIVVTISSKLSGTYESAVQAAQNFGGRVYVIDSLNACVGERLLAEYALRLIRGGKTAEYIAAELNRVKRRINLIAVLDTLEYLKRGGRISGAAAIAGQLLSIKPVVGIVDGEVKALGKAMGSKKGNNLLNKLVEEKKGIDFEMPYATVWTGLEKTTLEKYIRDSAQLWKEHVEEIPSYIVGATIGTHIGPGAVGVSFFEKE